MIGIEMVRTTEARLMFETELPVRTYIPKMDVQAQVFRTVGSRLRVPVQDACPQWPIFALS
jgi:uncharacterized protein (DUF427 family)